MAHDETLRNIAERIVASNDFHELDAALNSIEQDKLLNMLPSGAFAGFTYMVIRRILYLLIRNSVYRH